MTRLRSIRLVARREILERGRSRGFLFSIGFTTLIIIGSFVVPAILFDEDDARRVGSRAPRQPAWRRPSRSRHRRSVSDSWSPSRRTRR